jgi:transposase-like protein
MTSGFSKDIAKAKAALATLPQDWDGKKSVIELKEADYNWRQMEWWAFYFEHLCRLRLAQTFQIPGERFGTVRFDLKGCVNWDLKSKAIKSDDHKCILNDKQATNASIITHGEHGVIIALCDVEYNDENRTFQKWHTQLKGGLSDYEKERRTRTEVSRYRKTHAILREILFLHLDKSSVIRLGEMRQGRNSNGRPRPVKYMMDLEGIEGFFVDRLTFSGKT